MKYGALYYEKTENFGDDIQCYAALQYLPRVDYIIDREHIDDFVPDEKEYVATICNGWYQHNKFNFPMSPYIYPKLIAMHFTNKDPYDIVTTKENYDYLDGFSKKILTSYGKIGCRDKGTYEIMKSKGYDCYFSGCLTLTIDNIGKVEKKPYICVVDLNEKIVNHIKNNTDLEVKVMTQSVDPNEYSKIPFNERMKRVKNYLTIYQNASLVITNRLHVALPCLALKSNVVLVYYEEFKDRLETFKSYVNNMTEEELLNSKVEDLLKLENPKEYLKIRNSLKKECKEFIDECEKKKFDNEKLPDLDFYKNYLIPKCDYMEKIFIDGINEKKERINEMQKIIWDLEGTVKWCRAYIEELEKGKKQNKFLDKISSLRTRR